MKTGCIAENYVAKILSRVLKRIIFSIGNILYIIFGSDRHHKLTRDLLHGCEIQIYMRRPLGFGDLIMLAPFVQKIPDAFPENKVVLVTEYNPFIQFSRVIWKTPDSVNKNIQRLVISPTLALIHSRELCSANWYLGYYFSPRLIANIHVDKYDYDPANCHYLERVYPLLKTLDIDFDQQDFNYPDLISEEPPEDLPANYLCVAPFVNWRERQYPYEYYYEIIQEISRYIDVVIIGGHDKEEIEKNRKLYEELQSSNVRNYTNLVSLSQSIEIIRRSTVYLGNDSGPSHIAYIVAKHPIVIFGSVLPEHRLPMNLELCKNIETVDNRSMCYLYPCYNGLEKPCCNLAIKCLTSISPISVIEKIKAAL